MGTPVVLKNVRLFFNDLFEPVQFEGKGEHKYGAMFGVLKTDKAQLTLLQNAINAEAKEVFKDKAAKTLADVKGSKQQYCLRDGDNVDWEGAEGCYVLSAKRKQKDGRPNLRDERNRIITDDDGTLYSGCYVNAKVEIWAQSGEHKGIRCGLIGVQFAEAGASFSGATKPRDDDFEDLGEGAGDGFDDNSAEPDASSMV